jgi:hypothetical protein
MDATCTAWRLVLAVFVFKVGWVTAWMVHGPSIRNGITSLGMASAEDEMETSRRHFLALFAAGTSLLLIPPAPSGAATRAIGAAEARCQAAGNCLETGDWDGAVG